MTGTITATLPDETIAWLEATYPDATSNSARVAMAISDARLVRDGAEIRIRRTDPDGDS